MADRDAWPDDPNVQPATPPRAKKSGGCGKVVLIGCGLGLGTMLLCCGGGGWMLWSFMPKVEDNPAAIQQMAGQILDVQIPEGFQGEVGFTSDNFLWNMRMVAFHRKDGKAKLILGTFEIKFGNAQQLQEFQDKSDMNQHSRDLRIDKTEVREFQVQGKKIPFRFSEAVNPKTNQQFRVVEGEIPKPGGGSFLKLYMNADEYDDELAVKLIESIQ